LNTKVDRKETFPVNTLQKNSRRLLIFLIQPLFALIATIITATPLILLREHLSNSTVALLFLLPVTIVTTVLGLGAGLFCSVFAFLVFNYFFLQPYGTFKVHQTQDLIALLIFFLITVLISQLMGRAKRNLSQARSREKELEHLYELSTSLAGMINELEITEVLAQHIKKTFTAQFVIVTIHDDQTQEIIYEVHTPADLEIPNLEHRFDFSFHLKKGYTGKIRIWRDHEIDSELETQMMNNFITQGTVAYERASLAKIETKTKVLEESDRLKSILLSSVSHELRTPLSTIKASVTSLLNEQVAWKTRARKDLLSMIDEESDHLNRLVGNLLDMTRIEAGALKPNRQWNILSEIVEGVLNRMHRTLKDHYIEINIPENLPLIALDYIQMEQVFSNLLSNSAKYSPVGSIILIDASVLDDQYLLVKISNQGPKIDNEDLLRIFDKFYSVSRSNKVSGTGLGLSICKGIIEAHSGKIWAENISDGVAFIFSLPLLWKGNRPPIIESENI